MVIGSILVMAAPLKSIFDLVALTTPLGIQFPVSIVTRIEAGLTVGQALSAPNASNNGVYLIVTASGTGTAPAPTEALSVGNWVLSQGIGANWTKVNLSSASSRHWRPRCVGRWGVTGAGGVRHCWPRGPRCVGVGLRSKLPPPATAGIVRASTEVVVASGTGIMSIGTSGTMAPTDFFSNRNR
jgi:hypothetical protein